MMDNNLNQMKNEHPCLQEMLEVDSGYLSKIYSHQEIKNSSNEYQRDHGFLEPIKVIN
jgi:hypothetical protein